MATGPYGTAPADNPDYVWVQVDPSLNRDDVLQWFVNIFTGYRVWGKTSGSFSDHIHLYTNPGNVDTNENLDPVTSQVAHNGNLWSYVIGIGTVIAGVLFPPAAVLIGAVGGAVGGAVSIITQPGQVTPPTVAPPVPPAGTSSAPAALGSLESLLADPTVAILLIAALYFISQG